MSDGSKPLSLMLTGCKVLDFTQYLAGPTVTRLMAEIGADIIKVEKAPMGDPSRLLPVVDTIDHPHFKARNMVRTVPDPILGEVTIPGFPLKFSAYPDLPDIQAPLLGEHSADVLKEHLGYSDAQVAELREQGVLYSENR